MLLQLQSAGMTHGTALVVEDSPSDRLLLVRLLERLGCRADSVAGGADGVAAALTGAYDFVFMDVVMPGVDGLAATRFIHEHLGPRSPFIVAVTGLRSDQDRKRCAEAGMDYLLAKPVQRADLARLLDG
ncbi:MAG: two-component system, sensor histidine kinase [Thermoplasmata archaeon]|jgi:CheY-like chemotaxis protein|nr:two-component system, sensor histidine kinase [Thermoplasmata archaeon]